jgi:hypothetical protein
MSKATKRKARLQNQQRTKEVSRCAEQPQPRIVPHPSIWRSRPWGALFQFVLGAVTLFGLLSFAPRFALDPPTPPADPLNPFDQPFTLTNLGYLSVYGVSAYCTRPDVRGLPASGSPSFEKGKPFDAKANFILSQFVGDKLEPDDPRSIPCGSIRDIALEGQPAKVTFASVMVEVHFKLFKIIPWWKKQFPLQATLAKDGKLYWSHKALTGLGDSAPKQIYGWEIGIGEPS